MMILTHPQIYSEFSESLCEGHSVVHGVMAPEGRRPAGDLQVTCRGAGQVQGRVLGQQIARRPRPRAV